MFFPDVKATLAAALSFPSGLGGKPPLRIIEDEPQWRLFPRSPARTSSSCKVTAARWRALEEVKREVSAETGADHHVVAIVMRNENVRFSVGGRVVHDGPAAPGMLHITQPSMSAHCLFRGPYDVLHLHVPNGLIAEFTRETVGEEKALLCSKPTLMRDDKAEPLAKALLEAERIGGSFGRLYADYVSIAIVAWLLGSAQREPLAPPRQAGLPTWRLKRAFDYIEAHLAESVSLADIASAAGLTRMHFAAQFKAGTGLRPHEYLLRRRIERAQQLLVKPGAAVVDVALAVGFQNQSHFTNVFKRFVGQPPRSWCQAQPQGAC